MSSTVWRAIKLTLVLVVAAVMQAAFANSLKLWEARPDFLLITSLVGALFCGESGAALVGFAAALIYASLAAPPRAGFGSILVSRTAVCFSIGWMEDRMYRDSVLVAIIVVAAGTLLSECLFYLFYPQSNPFHWARILAITTVYNALIAAPCYYGMCLLLGKHGAKDRL